MYGEGQERWIDGHENEYKSATDWGGELEVISRTRQRPRIMKPPRIYGDDLR
jgi:UDP-N-acetyl-D-mannosaminuronic acid transferase (WecB/TagA/CpsF family)